jgi:hypothetical protein
MDAVFRPVDLLPRAEAAYHTVGVFVGVVFACVVAPVTGIDFKAAAESEPAVALGVMLAPTASR